MEHAYAACPICLLACECQTCTWPLLVGMNTNRCELVENQIIQGGGKLIPRGNEFQERTLASAEERCIT